MIRKTREKYIEAFRLLSGRELAVAVRDQLEKLVQEMLDKGVLYDDARREFEKMFIARALQRSKGSVGDAAELLGMHRNTVARKMTEYRIKRSREVVRPLASRR